MLKRFKNFLSNIWNWRKHRKINNITKSLEKAVINKSKNRRKLGKEIMSEVRSFLGIDKDDQSTFIPYDYKTRIRTKKHIETKFGNQMVDLNLKISDKLQLS